MSAGKGQREVLLETGGLEDERGEGGSGNISVGGCSKVL